MNGWLERVTDFISDLLRRIVYGSVRAKDPALLLILLLLAIRSLGPHGSGLPSPQFIQGVAHWTVPLVGASVVVGFLSMAILQLLKPEIRAAYHRTALGLWLGSKFAVNHVLYGVTDNPRDVLELPIEQLTAQIQAASDTALTFWSRQSNSPLRYRSDRYRELLRLILDSEAKPFWEWTTSDDPKQQSQVAYIIQRRLDDLQIRVKRGWKLRLRIYSFLSSLFIVSSAAGLLELWKGNIFGALFLVILLSLLGAFFASVARDLIAIIERLRN